MEFCDWALLWTSALSQVKLMSIDPFRIAGPFSVGRNADKCKPNAFGNCVFLRRGQEPGPGQLHFRDRVA